ncbi:MAG TPA: hypothetical protein VH500_10520 [Nitrososphaeraceae archaeon]
MVQKEKNDNLSFSKQEDEVVPTIKNAHGISLVEQVAIPPSDSNMTILYIMKDRNSIKTDLFMSRLCALQCQVQACVCS